MEHLSQYVIQSDDRGTFNGIVNKYSWGEVNLITTKSGVTRGNHYHRFTKELFFILEGRIRIFVRNIVSEEDWQFIATPKSSFIIDPYDVHVFYAIEDSSWLNMLSHRLDDERPDIYKFDQEWWPSLDKKSEVTIE